MSTPHAWSTEKPLDLGELQKLLEELRKLGIKPRGYSIRTPYETPLPTPSWDKHGLLGAYYPRSLYAPAYAAIIPVFTTVRFPGLPRWCQRLGAWVDRWIPSAARRELGPWYERLASAGAETVKEERLMV